MFASTARNRRPNFTNRKQQPSKPSRIAKFVSTTTVIALTTWGGVALAQYLAGRDGVDNGIIRFVNGLAYDISSIDPVLSVIAGGLFGMFLLVFFIRDHH
jgi:hypothetical protein